MRYTVKMTKYGKCPKGSKGKKKGKSRRTVCYLNGRHSMGRKGMYGKKRRK